MTALLQHLVDGLSLGAIYALIALGYTMVYGVLQLINFAHGDVFMLGAMVGWYASARWTGEAKSPSIGSPIARCARRPRSTRSSPPSASASSSSTAASMFLVRTRAPLEFCRG